jgi:peptide deformylase
MAVLNILKYPHPNLRLRAHPVNAIDADIHKLCDDMLETMYAASGIGLAATQVDVRKRVVVIDLSDGNVKGKYSYTNITQVLVNLSKPLCLINPEVKVLDKNVVPYEEGCLSVPNVNAVVKRPNKILLRAQTLQDSNMEIEATGLLATCLQHEIDHLDGKLFIDHLSQLKMQQVRRKFKLK